MDFGIRRQDFHTASGFTDKNISNKELEENTKGKRISFSPPALIWSRKLHKFCNLLICIGNFSLLSYIE